jgi:HAMP domain-containing protein
VLGGSLGLASVVLAIGLARGLSRRIRELERRTRLIAAGDFSPMPQPRRDDQLRDLARSVNDMAQRLAQLQETVQRSDRLRLLGQVSGGLAHQLRDGLGGPSVNGRDIDIMKALCTRGAISNSFKDNNLRSRTLGG